jgi:hypothetical protein
MKTIFFYFIFFINFPTSPFFLPTFIGVSFVLSVVIFSPHKAAEPQRKLKKTVIAKGAQRSEAIPSEQSHFREGLLRFQKTETRNDNLSVIAPMHRDVPRTSDSE